MLQYLYVCKRRECATFFIFCYQAVGEPPLFLASSAFFAIKEAIRTARADAGVSQEFRLDAPATSARIRMACEDHITKKVTTMFKHSIVVNIYLLH